MKLDRADADIIYRTSFAAFVYAAWGAMYPGTPLIRNWHIDALCWELQSLYIGRKKPRLVVCMPPRSLKSFICSICLPAWLLGHKPAMSIIAASYSDDLARKFSRECRALIETSFYKHLFPRTRLSAKKTSETEFETTKRGSRLATSVGGTLTGRGCDILIVDDPLKAQDAYSEVAQSSCTDWFSGTAMTRLNDPRGSKVIVVMQRLHVDDLAGYLIDRGWRSLVLPAVATRTQRFTLWGGKRYRRLVGDLLQTKRDSRKALDEIKQNHGSHVYASQYQQSPVPVEGNIIKASWLKRYTQPLSRDQYKRVLVVCDPGGNGGPKNDFTAIIVVGMLAGDFHVLDVCRGHWEILQMRDRINECANKWRADQVIVENAASGMGLISILKGAGRFSVLGMNTKDDKVTRLYRQQAKFECGQIVLPTEAPWLAEFEHELMAFPHGRYDDQVDALLLTLDWYTNNQRFFEDPPRIVIPVLFRSERSWDRFANHGY